MKQSSKYSFFPWRLIRAAFMGKSSIDTPYLAIGSIEEAEYFISRYGYDWSNPEHQAFLIKAYNRGLEFVQEQLIDPFPEELVIPEPIRKCTDMRQLVFWANPKAFHRKIQLWACAMLKVCHTILHLENDFLIDYFQEARRQIFERFDGHLFVDSENKIYLGQDKENLIPLHHFEVKKEKNFNSRLIKLLHKAENTSATIHDRIGVRMVAVNFTDTVAAFSYLAKTKIVVISNIAATRSKNTLLNLDKYQIFMNRLLKKFAAGTISLEEIEKKTQMEFDRNDYLIENPVLQEINPHTLGGFKAIQFTCRHLVRFQNPTYTRLNELKEKMVREKSSPYLIEDVDSILESTKREIRFFFPFEIQLMDKEAWDQNQHGEASHHEYKQAQLMTARKRVLGKLLCMTEEEIEASQARLQARISNTMV